MFVALVGPDGAGKTTVAIAVEQAARRQGIEFAYVHYRPGLRAPGSSVPLFDGPPPEKNKRPLSVSFLERFKSFGRLGLNWLRFWAGYLLGMRRHVPELRSRGVIVVADRWMYNFVVQPDSCAYYGPQALAKLAVRLAPRPDFTVVLDAPASVIVSRKNELTSIEAECELARWRNLKLPNPVVVLDATATPEAIANDILSLATRLRGRGENKADAGAGHNRAA